MKKISLLKEKFVKGNLSKLDFINQAFDIHRTLFDFETIIKNTDIKEIKITNRGVSFLVGEDNIWLYAPAEEKRVVPIEIMNFGRYEPEETKVMDILTTKSRQILDIGANIGWFSVRFAKRNPLAIIHAFEPMPVSNAYLQRNVAVNHVGGQVICYNYGLSDQSDCFDFYVEPTNGTNASLCNVASVKNAITKTGLTMTLDQWVSNQQISPDFIKCDVEGAELLVFIGGKETLARVKPVVFTELLRKWTKPFGYHPNDVLDFFGKLGYCCFAIGNPGIHAIEIVTEETSETNFFFLHKDVHKDIIASMDLVNET